MAQHQTARLLRLLSLLQGRREWSGSELAERLEVTGRTVRRDIDGLRELGYPIEGTTGVAGGYRLRSGSELPPLLLDDEEAIAIATGLRTAAGAGIAGLEEASVRALAKLEQLLPARLRRQVEATASATTAVPVPRGARLDPATLGTVAAACRDHEVLAFDYRTRQGESGRRRVEPHSLVAVTGLWYLVAYDLGRQAWRVYRLDRLARPLPTRLHFVARPLPATDAAELVRQRLREAPYRYQVTVTVDLPAEEVRARLPRLLPSRLRELDGGACRIELGDDEPGRLVADLALLDAEPQLEGTPQTLTAIAHAAGRVAQAASPPDRHDREGHLSTDGPSEPPIGAICRQMAESGVQGVNPGLCAHCRHGAPIAGARSTFWLCERSRIDPTYPRYPGLPVLRCPGFDDRQGHLSTDGPSEPPDPGHLSTDG